MEIIYCSKCGSMIPPGGIEEGKHLLVDGEPVCGKCAGKLPQAELSRATPTQVPATERKRPTSKLMAAAHKSPGKLPAAPFPEGAAGHRPWIYAAAGGVALLLILAVFIALRGDGPEPYRPPVPPPADIEEPEEPPGKQPDRQPEKQPEKQPGPADPKSFYAKAEFDGFTLELLEYRGTLKKESHRPVLGTPGTREAFGVDARGATNGNWKFKEVPPLLRDRLRIRGPSLAENRDKPDLYRVKASGPCTVYAVYVRHKEPRPLPWMDREWRPTGLTCRTTRTYEVRKRELPGGEFLLGGGTKGSRSVNYVFIPAGAGAPPPPPPGERPGPPEEQPAPAEQTGFVTRLPDGTLRLPAEADAYLYGEKRANYGEASIIKVDADKRASGFVRFDVSALRGPVRSAVLRFRYRYRFKEELDGAVIGLAPVESQDWGEMSISGKNEPPAGPVCARWTASADSEPRFDVTGPVNAALAAGRKKVSFKLTMERRGRDPTEPLALASRDFGDAAKHPALEITPGQ
jgi:hypothetical protein